MSTEESLHQFDAPRNRSRSNNTSYNNTNNNNTIVDPMIAFAKSQAILNSDYKRRMRKFSGRMVTGKNLKNLQPLAVRAAEFC